MTGQQNTDTTPAPLDLAAIQARADAATPGPWDFEYSDQSIEVNAGTARTRWTESGTGFPAGHWTSTDRIIEHEDLEFMEERDEEIFAADAEFIAHARSDIPDLIAELTQAREALADCVPLTGFDYDDHQEWETEVEGQWDSVEFFVHVTGPDDVHPARSWDEAAQLAHGMNTGAIRYLTHAAARGAEHPTRMWAIPMDRAHAVAADLIEPREGNVP
jgi:hypothetical protein